MSSRKVYLNRRISNKEFRTAEVKPAQSALRNLIFLVQYSKFQIFLFRAIFSVSGKMVGITNTPVSLKTTRVFARQKIYSGTQSNIYVNKKMVFVIETGVYASSTMVSVALTRIFAALTSSYVAFTSIFVAFTSIYVASTEVSTTHTVTQTTWMSHDGSAGQDMSPWKTPASFWSSATPNGSDGLPDHI